MRGELLSCPFCGGGKARSIHIRDGRKVACICGACSKPEFHGPLDKPDAETRAIAAWNTRAPDPSDQEKPQWQPIETAPRDGSWIITAGGGADFGMPMKWCARVGAWECDACMLEDWDDQAEGYSRPTHWMPLPASPVSLIGGAS